MKTDLGLPWLSPDDQRWAVKKFLEYGLLKFSNEKKFPLKSGGYTDIYFAAGDTRNSPDSIRFLAELYARAIKNINPDRFVEIPDAVSGIAGYLSYICNKPYITIRDCPKEGRVTDARIIGNAVAKETFVIIDDVITDGTSKLAPYQECLKRDLACVAIVVIIDRQQGWKENFDKLEIKTTVYAGMTLQDVRDCLVKLGEM